MLEAHDLTKRYGDLVAANRVSLTVPAGHLVGFVGGNGAGKTTTMRMLMGILDPDEGSVSFAGRPATRADRASFGYLPEERGLYPKQKVIDQLVYFGELHGMPRADASTRATAMLERLGLGGRLKSKLEELSLGNQQRVQLVAAILHHPTALILDEPFSGLDPDAVDAMTDVLREHAAEGVPVLFSSHQLDVVERLCDSLVIMAKGEVRAAGSIESLRSTGRIRHRLVCEPDAGWVREMPGVSVVDVDGPRALVELTDPAAEQELVRQAVSRGALREFAPVLPTVSDIYREVTA